MKFYSSLLGKPIFLFLLIILALGSCASKKNTTLKAQLNTSNCNQENNYHYRSSDIPKSIHEISIDPMLSSKFQEKELNVANAIGIVGLLSEYSQKKEEVKKNNSLQNQLDLIKIRQNINSKLDLASLEISSVAAELDCEEKRISQIAAFLKEKEMKKETRLTVGSIILGSVTAIVTGVLLSSESEGQAADYLAVGVGIADAAMGVMILTNHRKVELSHKRNVLRDIWMQTSTSEIYPPSIWYYLNYYNPNKKGEISLRKQLIENWKNFEQVSTNKKKTTDIDFYFGDGGNYSTDQLENRAHMYEQIESTIKLMKQDLRNLSVGIENF